MVFCNEKITAFDGIIELCHNPYFNRWFSAMASMPFVDDVEQLSHNPYFNRWFSAIR